jgi:hypothetical protein
MKLLKRIGVLGVASGLVVAGSFGPASAQAGVAGLGISPVSNAALTAPVRHTYGRVKSIVGPVLTLDVNGRDMRLLVDESTEILARGASRATRRAGGSLPIGSLVHNGDVTRVSYRERDGALRALAIQVRARSTVASR